MSLERELSHLIRTARFGLQREMRHTNKKPLKAPLTPPINALLILLHPAIPSNIQRKLPRQSNKQQQTQDLEPQSPNHDMRPLITPLRRACRIGNRASSGL